MIEDESSSVRIAQRQTSAWLHEFFDRLAQCDGRHEGLRIESPGIANQGGLENQEFKGHLQWFVKGWRS